MEIIANFSFLIQHPLFLLFVTISSFMVKTYFLVLLLIHGSRLTTLYRPYIFLIATLASSLFIDMSWLVKLSRTLELISITYTTELFFIRLSWCFLILQYQLLSFFIQSLIQKKFSLHNSQKILFAFSVALSFCFFTLACGSILGIGSLSITYTQFEITLSKYVIFYLLYGLIIPSIYFTSTYLYTKTLPKILKKQLTVLITYFICPYLTIELLQMCCIMFHIFQHYLYGIVSFSTIIFTYTTYYCLKKIMYLGFLNIFKHIKSSEETKFFENCKSIFKQLHSTTNIQEMHHIIQAFFKETFNIPIRMTHFHVLNSNHIPSHHESALEHFTHIITHTKFYLKKKCILVYDDIMFSTFYEDNAQETTTLEFLQALHADIFIPLYHEKQIIAYIIVMRGARQEYYSKYECDQMVMFAHYISLITHTLQNTHHYTHIKQKNELKKELYHKQQQINHYQEAIKYFLRYKQQRIGIVCYKNNHFILGNQASKELIKVNLNLQVGHELTKAFKQIAKQVEQYKTPQTLFTTDTDGTQLIISGTPHIEKNMVIITVHYPDISDIINAHIDYLNDPRKRDYLLYLYTTKHGNLLNQFIPDECDFFLNFKINMLIRALSGNILVLDVPTDDQNAFAQILHHISNRVTLYTLTIQGINQSEEIALQLFGSQTITLKSEIPPLLEQLHPDDTLFIKHIHLLNHEVQEYIAEFLSTGSFRPYKGNYTKTSNVQIICSIYQDLEILIENKVIIPELARHLRNGLISLPHLNALPQKEIHHLIHGFTQQVIKTQEFKNLLTLTEKEKSKIIKKNPISMQELKTIIYQILIHKSKSQYIINEIKLDPAYLVTDPELIDAARLGKHALKDSKIMAILWKKFKNQNQIAHFLGVHRSSINRRCKEYNLGKYMRKHS